MALNPPLFQRVPVSSCPRRPRSEIARDGARYDGSLPYASLRPSLSWLVLGQNLRVLRYLLCRRTRSRRRDGDKSAGKEGGRVLEVVDRRETRMKEEEEEKEKK